MTSNFNSKQDPDYDKVISTPESFRRQDEEKSKRENSIKKIRDIIERQFNGEIQAKEEEVMNIEKKISQTKSMLDQLRAYLLANYYGCNGRLMKGHMFEKKKRQRKHNGMKLKKGSFGENLNQMEEDISKENGLSDDRSATGCPDSGMSLDKNKCALISSIGEVKFGNCIQAESTDVASFNRFYLKKNVIVGNISKFIPLEKRDKNDQATHKWMVYVRGLPGEPELSSFIQRVWFILHPSYMPNDIIEVARPPFTVTRRGWGEFPVRIQLVFNDPRNKPVDIIHNLKLDKTYTGLQTLGAETNVAIELQRHTIDEISERDTIKAPSNVLKGNEITSSSSNVNGTPSMIFPEVGKLPSISNDNKSETELAMGRHDQTLNEHSFNTKTGIEPEGGDLKEFTKVKVSSISGASITKEDSLLPISCPGNRICSSLPSASSKGTIQFDDFIERALLKNMSRFPLICADRDITTLHYCAKTVQQFSTWSFSKRRACEWQRALDVKRYLSRNGISDGITTKKVMLWCRMHGFTPAENNGLVAHMDDLDHCPKCGKCFPDGKGIGNEEAKTTHKWCSSCLSDLTIKDTSTLTSFEVFIGELASQESSLCGLTEKAAVRSDSEDTFVDVVGTENTENHDNSEEIFDPREIEPFEASMLTDWIFEAAAQIEVDLRSVSMNQQKAPILQQILLNAMKLFIREILSQSFWYAKNCESNLDPVVITPMHVFQALRSTDHMDFLTNKFFGIEKEDGNI